MLKCKNIKTLDGILKKNGFDGLYCSEGECACEIGDLSPCGEYSEDCKPGYKKTYDELSEEMKVNQDPDCDMFIVRDK